MLSVAININLVDYVDAEELVDAVNSGDFLIGCQQRKVGKFCLSKSPKILLAASSW